jgi:hypothetical protein
MNHRKDYLARKTTEPVKLSAYDSRLYLLAILNYECYEADEPDVEPMRFYLKKVSQKTSVIETVKEWSLSAPITGRMLGVVSYLLLEYADLSGQIDQELSLWIYSRSLECNEHKPYYPDFVVMFIAYCYCETKNQDLLNALRSMNIDPKSLCSIAAEGYRNAINVAPHAH